MTNEELLVYAKENYTVGKYIKSTLCDGGAIRKIDYYGTEDHIDWRINRDDEICAFNGILTEYGSGNYASVVIYRKGKWAPLICNNYEIY